MPFTVFYAWQSDRDEKVNHYLIHNALQNAIDSVNANLRIEEAPDLEANTAPANDHSEVAIEIDWATKDEPGTPNVAQAIFTKIQECGVFLADLTYVAETESADGRKKMLPNSNVMIELGQAAASVGWKQILLVMNKHFGGPEHLPFDLKNYAFPIIYDLSSGADKTTRDAEGKKLAKAIEHKLRIMQRREVWTRKAEELERKRIAVQEMQEARAQRERESFEAKVLQDKFCTFSAARGILALSIIPAEPLKKPLSLVGQEVKLKTFLAPMRTDYSTSVEPYGRSVVTSSPPTSEYPFSRKRPPQAVTELTENGMIFAVDNWLYIENEPPNPVPQYRMKVYQPSLVQAVRRYINGLGV